MLPKTYFQYCNEYLTIILLVLKLRFYSPYKINYSLNSISLFHSVFKPNSKERYYTFNVKQKNQNLSWEIIPPLATVSVNYLSRFRTYISG